MRHPPDVRNPDAGTGTGARKTDRLASAIEGENTDPTALPQARFLIRSNDIREGTILARRGGRLSVRWPNGTGAWLLTSCIVADDDLFAWAA